MEVCKYRNRGKGPPVAPSWVRGPLDGSRLRIEAARRSRRRTKSKRPAKGNAPIPVLQPLLPKPRPSPPSARLSPPGDIDLTLPSSDIDTCAEESNAPVSSHSSATPETATSTIARLSQRSPLSRRPSEAKHVLAQSRADGFGDHTAGNASPLTVAPVLPKHRPPGDPKPSLQPIVALEVQGAPSPASSAGAWRCSENCTPAMPTSDTRQAQEAQRYQDHIPVIARFQTINGKPVNETAIFDPNSECGTVNLSTAKKLGYIFPYKPGRKIPVTIPCDPNGRREPAEEHQLVQSLRHEARSPEIFVTIQGEFPTLVQGRFILNLMVREDELEIANVVFGMRAIHSLCDQLPGFEAQLPGLCGTAAARNATGASGLDNQAMARSCDARLASQQSEAGSQYGLPSPALAESQTYLGDLSERLSSSASTLCDPSQHVQGSNLEPLVVSYTGLGSFQQDGSPQGFTHVNLWEPFNSTLANMSPQSIYHYPQTPVHYSPIPYVETCLDPDGLYPQSVEPAWAFAPTQPSWHDSNIQGGN